MRGQTAKKIRRIAQETAEPSRRRHGYIKDPLAWRREAYLRVCLGVRRRYLDLKKAFKNTLDMVRRPPLKDADRLAMIGGRKGDAKRQRRIIGRATA